MTEITANTDRREARSVRPGPFTAALVLAPLSIGLPAWALVWLSTLTEEPLVGPLFLALFPAAALVVGAPTYLLFGGPALWRAIRRGYSAPGSAFLANLVSLPFVTAYAALMTGDIIATLAIFAFFGSIFAPLWGLIFAALYRRFSGEESA